MYERKEAVCIKWLLCLFYLTEGNNYEKEHETNNDSCHGSNDGVVSDCLWRQWK